jgi:hypothetical protein
MADSAALAAAAPPPTTTEELKHESPAEATNGHSTAQPAVAAQIDPKTELDFEGNVAVNDTLPTAAELEALKDVLLFSADGSSRTFGSLLDGTNSKNRQLVLFVRHFFCGVSDPSFSELA